MNWLDIVILVLVAWCLVRGLMRGLISEIAGILGVVVGFWAAYKWHAGMAEYLSGWVQHPDSIWQTHPHYISIASFLVLFVLVYLGVSLIGWAIKAITRIVSMGWADRLVGGIFGVAKAVLIGFVIILAITVLNRTGEATIVNESRLAPHVTQLGQTFINAFPTDWREDFKMKLDALKSEWSRQ
ncbi:MAG: CvpA family protein [Desulfatibacillaceae bacterium]|nr:CvpA family protein [Desulfatibacillaceae bacterium]